MRVLEREIGLASGLRTITLLSALLLGGCAAEPGKPAPGPVPKDVYTDADGTVIERTAETSPFVLEEDDKAGCTHIRFCDQPNSSNVIVCDTNDSTTGSCSASSTRCFECCSDARSVCGTANPITFDPPLPGGTCICG